MADVSSRQLPPTAVSHPARSGTKRPLRELFRHFANQFSIANALPHFGSVDRFLPANLDPAKVKQIQAPTYCFPIGDALSSMGIPYERDKSRCLARHPRPHGS